MARFLEAARATPERDAVIGPDVRLTFAELDERTDRLAGLLARYGAGPERSVGVFLPRSADLVVAILAVLKAGAVYVPFDPEQPAERLAHIAEDAGVVTTITHADLVGKVPQGIRDKAIVLDRLDWDDLPPAQPLATHPDNLAYIVFTSGSTGRPKGVQVSLRALASFLEGMEAGGFFRAPGERVGWNASVAFDASVQEWVRVFRGDTVAILDDDTRRDAEAFARFVADHELDVVDMTPSHAQVLLEELEPVARGERPGLKLLIAGEAVPPALWDALGALVSEGVLEAANLYGPTEATVNALGTPIVRGRTPHIGAPLKNVDIRIVDARLDLVPDGTPGELCLAGPGLARGYAGRPGLTASSFVPDPYGPDGSRMYRTGDRVSRAEDGTVIYLGRTDSQVKIRGHRVELGGIEAVLHDHPGVRRACVVCHTGDDGAPRLEALVELVAGTDLASVQAHAERLLPLWMCPAGYSALEKLPVTVGGKVDRVALTRLAGSTSRAQPSPSPEPEAPADASGVSLPETVNAVWSEVLGVTSIAESDDFFDLGGHSLSAMQVATRLRTRLGIKVPTSLLFRHRTFDAFAAALADRRAEELVAR
ncbi:non-ribosomal peptide synthetase [Streptomyces sp. NPDC002588]|uniref:non-ribosomal peptide synthetase n=1 Tax=Streptomyces sp. NPDC002588 TaxID=3154419 RepID=UPI003330793D